MRNPTKRRRSGTALKRPSTAQWSFRRWRKLVVNRLTSAWPKWTRRLRLPNALPNLTTWLPLLKNVSRGFQSRIAPGQKVSHT
jgi:hypothetical protein